MMLLYFSYLPSTISSSMLCTYGYPQFRRCVTIGIIGIKFGRFKARDSTKVGHLEYVQRDGNEHEKVAVNKMVS